MRIGIDATVRTGFIDSIWFGEEGAHTDFFLGWFQFNPFQSQRKNMEFRICSQVEKFRDPLAESSWHWHNLLPCLVYHSVARNPHESCAFFLWNNSGSFLFSTVWDHFSVKAYRAYADSHLNQLIHGAQFDQSVLLAKFWDSKCWNILKHEGHGHGHVVTWWGDRESYNAYTHFCFGDQCSLDMIWSMIL